VSSILGIVAGVAQLERRQTSQRVADALAFKRSQGKLLGSLPAGYTRNPNGKILVDEAVAATVRLALEQYATGGFSYKTLAAWLNERGIKTVARRGGNGAPPDCGPATSSRRCSRALATRDGPSQLMGAFWTRRANSLPSSARSFGSASRLSVGGSSWPFSNAASACAEHAQDHLGLLLRRETAPSSHFLLPPSFKETAAIIY
jgi:hypothetical protein